MTQPALPATELLEWNDETAQSWKKLLAAHPEALDFPCDVYGAAKVQGLLRHIFAVETRYAQRLSGEPVTPYEQIPEGPAEVLFALHDAAVEKYRKLLAEPSVNWQERLEFTTVSAGTQSASRKKILIHALLHGIRHYAQLATLARAHGVKPDWAMDFMFSGTMQ
jgi:uncharacterized damage-inducible protein DinB